MKFEPKIIYLKDGRQAILRSPRAEDAVALLEYLMVTAGETEFLLRYPEECGMTVEQEERFLKSMVDSPDSAMILCEIGGRIAGNCQLSRHGKIKTRHRGDIGIALCREFWGLGIGTAMMETLIGLGQSWGLSQLELEVIQGNERAMALYRKMGFTTVAEKPNAIRLKDGAMLSEFIMIRPL